MGKLILKFNRLSELHQQEVLDFVNFLLSKEHRIGQETTTSEANTNDNYDFFESAGLRENRDIDANQLRRDAWKINL